MLLFLNTWKSLFFYGKLNWDLWFHGILNTEVPKRSTWSKKQICITQGYFITKCTQTWSGKLLDMNTWKFKSQLKLIYNGPNCNIILLYENFRSLCQFINYVWIEWKQLWINCIERDRLKFFSSKIHCGYVVYTDVVGTIWTPVYTTFCYLINLLHYLNDSEIRIRIAKTRVYYSLQNIFKICHITKLTVLKCLHYH